MRHPLAVDTIVRQIRDYVTWPKLRPGERLDVVTGREMGLMDEDRSELRISAYRFFPDKPFGGDHRELHTVVDLTEATRRFMYTGRKELFIEPILSAMRTLSLILAAKPPKHWRLFGRAAPPATRWSRLMTRPLPVPRQSDPTKE